MFVLETWEILICQNQKNRQTTVIKESKAPLVKCLTLFYFKNTR